MNPLLHIEKAKPQNWKSHEGLSNPVVSGDLAHVQSATDVQNVTGNV
jgi:hypothetical protein